MMPLRIAPYILAGGRSTRMGRDKAMVTLSGSTLLARAVETFRSVYELNSPGSPAVVTVIGSRTLLEGADRAIPDNYFGCGPISGMEAALQDMQATGAADWAMFLPVDMPLLPVNMVDALLQEWGLAANQGARVCLVVVDGIPQPLVSLVHREIHPFLFEALEARELRVTPVLQSACNALASIETGTIPSTRKVFWQTIFNAAQICPIDQTWSPTVAQLRTRHLWFANLNTEHELRDAETFLSSRGSTDWQQAIPI